MINKIKKVLFFREFGRFTGGHLKIWHYFSYLNKHRNYEPNISFSENSLWDQSNPWFSIKKEVLASEKDINPDIVFLGGFDWLRWEKIKKSIPTLNLIQHVRHVNPELPLRSFLKNRAIRICVSDQVQQALIQSKLVNGPIYTIPNGLDWSFLPNPLPFEQRETDILIAGLKNEELALRLYEKLKYLNKSIKILTKLIPQKDYLECISQAQITVFLPKLTEGFYLPALEGMALEALVICPDCVGNRHFCLPEINCLQPEYTFEGLIDAVNTALSASEKDKKNMLTNAKTTASKHNLETERNSFLDIINNITQIW